MHHRLASALLLIAVFATGCGYTVLEHPAQQGATSGEAPPPADAGDAAPAPEARVSELILPPGHPRLIEPEDWVGSSFLDDIVGPADPMRFENLREDVIAPATLQNATLTLRITIGGPATSDVWQFRMDEFGWVTVSYWTQGFAGPELDEGLATERVEFRLERRSEAALRMMMIDLLPKTPSPPQLIRPHQLRDIPPELWPYETPGLLELLYRIETPEIGSPEDWPGGRLSAPLDLMQLLIGTWHSAPPPELQRDIWLLAQDRPLLLNLALFVEAIILAWEVEGGADPRIELPLWVGR
ncbi:MAG: hypothetical protein GF330_13340 [Candidatus Eisenbacteria bacterium]|nr:hypothetical protein [Candidatus Eisenbacteria bacterium]